MKIIHTSDWHLGRYLNKTKKRYEEFSAFLSWLVETINHRQVEVLIVAGDIFDNTTPTHKAQELYYNFLRQTIVGSPSCRHVVVVGGNHDSPSFLEAPAKLLKGLGVHVLGASSSDSQREVLALRDLHGQLELVVCAVPFLREADLRLAEMGDSDDDRHKKIIIGLTSHYQKVADLAKDINNQNQSTVPVIATGHLFLSGSTTLTDDGVREIHAGPMSALPLEILPNFDYLALGHLHTAQLVGKKETVRYSGSPIPMGFNEAAQKKSICLIEFEGLTPQVEQIEVPVFQPIKRLQGDLKALISQIKDLKGTKAWLEIIHTGTGLVTDLRRQLDEASTGLDLEILAVKDNHLNNLIMSAEEEYLSLNDLSLEAIFDRLLKDSNTPEEERPALRTAHAQLVAELESNDVLAE